MIRQNLKFIIGGILILGTVGWLGASGFQESKSYYKTADELAQMGDDAYGKRIKVAGTVVKGSIQKQGDQLNFQISNNGTVIPVSYIGSAPIPDTFADEVQAVAEGSYRKDGVFEAKNLQAKCASKYEPEYNSLKEDKAAGN